MACPICGLQGATGLCGSCAATQQMKKHAESSSKRGSCFSLDTPIETPEGLRLIGSLCKGDYVLSYDGKSGKKIARKIIRKNTYSSGALFSIKVENCIKPTLITKKHSIQTDRGWTRVSDLKKGDVVDFMKMTGEVTKEKIERIDKVEKCLAVANLIVEAEHTFIANGLIAHSYSYFRGIRSFLNNVLHLNASSVSWSTRTA